MAEPKKFQVGQHWRSRDGNKWRILAMDGPDKREPIIAMNGSTVGSFDLTGGYHYDEDVRGEDHLIELWADKKPRMTAWLVSNIYSKPGVFDVAYLPEGSTPKDFGVHREVEIIRAPWLDQPEDK